MSEGFGHLGNLKDLDLMSCHALGSLPESESRLTSHFLISNFGNLMSEGFGHLANLQVLLMSSSGIEALPESEAHVVASLFP